MIHWCNSKIQSSEAKLKIHSNFSAEPFSNQNSLFVMRRVQECVRLQILERQKDDELLGKVINLALA